LVFIFMLRHVGSKQFWGLVRNFFWAGESDKKARVQVRWDSIIQLMSKGGKILDPNFKPMHC